VIESLPRREREVFETLCRLEAGTAAGVRDALSDPLSDSAVRTMLSRLEAKGLVERDGGSRRLSLQPRPAAPRPSPPAPCGG
jgi:predicted transcriptional regulator